MQRIFDTTLRLSFMIMIHDKLTGKEKQCIPRVWNIRQRNIVVICTSMYGCPWICMVVFTVILKCKRKLTLWKYKWCLKLIFVWYGNMLWKTVKSGCIKHVIFYVYFVKCIKVRFVFTKFIFDSIHFWYVTLVICLFIHTALYLKYQKTDFIIIITNSVKILIFLG